jgi:hypothetical protein
MCKQGSRGFEDCLAEFSSSGSATGSHFDYVPQSGAALTASAASSAAACEAECRAAAGADDGCQYYEWRVFAAPGQQCFLRRLGLKPFVSADAAAPKVMFLVSWLAFQQPACPAVQTSAAV